MPEMLNNTCPVMSELIVTTPAESVLAPVAAVDENAAYEVPQTMAALATSPNATTALPANAKRVLDQEPPRGAACRILPT
jgi:hypothetical protein